MSTTTKVLDVHGVCCALTLEAGLPAAQADAWDEVLKEFACFPQTARPVDLPVTIRAPKADEVFSAPGGGPGWLAARVTPEIWIRWRPRPAAAEVVVHGEALLDELVLAVWARVATALRFVGPPGGELASFHAASWVGPAGAALILGESGAGKTTLSRYLTHGPTPRLGYLGDEDALVQMHPDKLELLALPRRLRLLHRDPSEPLAGRTFQAFGEGGWLADRPAATPDRAPLACVVELSPGPAGTPTQLVPLPRDQLAYALLTGFERFPPLDAPDETLAENLRAANRAGFEAARRVAAELPGYRLEYAQPANFLSAADCLAALLCQGTP